MRAIVQRGYGAPEAVLQFGEIDDPQIEDTEALVRVQAASIHIGDCHGVRGVPYVMRPLFSRSMAKNDVPGTDIAGTVESVGGSVTDLRPGDEVFGWCKGAFAEYVAVSEETLTKKPDVLTFEQASAAGVSAFTALHALRDHGHVEPGQKVLINGASGGVGTFAVQVAKSLGAEVTGVCSTRNVEMVTDIGADNVIDYTEEDFTRGAERYDLILDNVGNHSLAATRSVLRSDGTLLANGAPVNGWVGGLGRFGAALVLSFFVSRQGRPFVSMPNREDLAALVALLESEEIVPVVGRTYPLAEAPEAMAHVVTGHSRGVTVITM